jgi:hypothetical protein
MYDSEIQCNCHRMGVAYNKNFTTVMTVSGTVIKVADLDTSSIK